MLHEDPAGGIVKLTKITSIAPQDTGLEPVAGPPCWASKTAVSPNLTIPSAGDDASTGIDLIATIASSARTVTADAAYDTLAFYETANTRGTTVVVPPAKTAKLSRRNPRSSARDGTIRRISKIGRRRWKKEVGYHRQARVENAFFRYTSILGDRLRRRTRAAQAVESVRACTVLNRMTELGRPESCAIDR